MNFRRTISFRRTNFKFIDGNITADDTARKLFWETTWNIETLITEGIKW
jgi:hypothetical protein